MCLMAISRDDLERVLPNPEFMLLSSCFGGGSFLMFTTLSTI